MTNSKGRVAAVITALESIAPPDLAESWDNVGLLVGSPTWAAKRVLLTIDLTATVMDEAATRKTQMVVAYHPPIFAATRTMTDASAGGATVLAAAAKKIAIYSPHTALDATPGGVNDWLAAGCGPGQSVPLTVHTALPPGEAFKVITFVPAEFVNSLRVALADAGAGHIGDYDTCSFESIGEGTFRGGATTNPVVGRRGRLERVPEHRIEMVSSQRNLAAVVAALRSHHPYEEPAFEIHGLTARPVADTGAGRLHTLDEPATMTTLAARLKKHLGVRTLWVAPAAGAARRHQKIGLCPGAGGSLLEDAISVGCDCFVTGEMRHHDVLAANARGVSVILAGHTNTERGYLKVLARRLRPLVTTATFEVARRDRDPLKVV